ncbi:hypothetical protein G7Z17_g6988 [Cylindrodendrum hubeiense]|uniref:Peptidase S8/S53 domain-containing protein n=1 Tax=Cylindrodendrum hubeiense TaxID=595255 RepID=A0A9P5H7Y6_9HYPO|nr:hypothetical protein G7Z17_g6988 [Cylindrodendrum hubeiense]
MALLGFSPGGVQLPNSTPSGKPNSSEPVVDGSDGICHSHDYDQGQGDWDELESEHRCPALVALAVILMEIYFVTPFNTLAKNHGIELIYEPSGRVSLADALLVFYGEEEDEIEGCRSQIPEDYEDGNLLDNNMMRPRIYDEVVRPLEAHLTHGFSQIPLEGLDKTQKYVEWRSNYDNVYEKFITSCISSSPSPSAVKIAILDTGIDRDNVAFEAREENIKGRFNWHNEEFKKRVPDRNGHGTFNASLLLDYAPDADLYIAKIVDKENARPSAHIVTKAIDFAVREWKVDIISMSFGWPTRDFEGYEELEAAIEMPNPVESSCSQPLPIAAGGKAGPILPAAPIPTASPDDISLATVGESVESAWPQSLCDDNFNPLCLVGKSGTSCAIPIAAGIAAFLLQYARLHLSQKNALALKQRDRMMAVLKRIAERGPGYKPRDDYYYIELSLNADNLFGKGKALIDLEIADILTN